MLPELTEIKQLRKQLGFTQSQLAAETGISQSLVTKIESGNLVPAYDKAKRIFDYLESAHRKTELTAKEIMVREVVSIKPEAKVRDAVRLMGKKGISQLPVIANGKVLGSITEKIIIEKLHNSKNSEKAKELRAEEIMEDSLPIILENTPFRGISNLLEYNNGLLVAHKGKIAGIITKADVLSAMFSRKKKY
jgi:predicted transcriptional regulator